MLRSFARSMFRRLSPVASRDRLIADLRRRGSALRRANDKLLRRNDKLGRQQTKLRAQIDTFPELQVKARNTFVRRSSFQARVHAERRLRALEVTMGLPSTDVERHGKFYMYDFARSHGIDVPEEYGRWDDPADIPWDDLPDHVVIKSAFGSTSRGVLPLRRTAGGWQVVAHDESMPERDLVTSLTTKVDSGTLGGPFVAEELLDADGSATRLPIDVKFYAFYGEVPLVVLRRPDRHGQVKETWFRIIDTDGNDVTEFETRSRVTSDIPVPDAFPELLDVATRLSVAIRAPFVRIDLYDIGGRIVFGEITPRPGGKNFFGTTIDRMLGDAWDRADVLLTGEVARGMSREPEFGPH